MKRRIIIISLFSLLLANCDSSVKEIGVKDTNGFGDVVFINDLSNNILVDAYSDYYINGDNIEGDVLGDYEGDVEVNDVEGDAEYTENDGVDVGGDVKDIGNGGCQNSCECPEGFVCFDRICQRYEDVLMFNPIFCCTSNICPQNARCEYIDGRKSTCGSVGTDGGLDHTDVSDIKDITEDVTDISSDTGSQDTGVISCDGGIITENFWDRSDCPGGREICPTGRTYRINRWRYNGRDYLIFSNYTSADFYDVTNPGNPILAYSGSPYTPWGQDECCQPDDDTEQWDLALLPDNTLGLGMFQNFGWVTFRVNVNAQGKITGFETINRCRIQKNYIPTSQGARNATLFYGNGGRIYAVAAYMSLCSGGGDGSVEIADITDPRNPQVVSSLPDTSVQGLLRRFVINNRTYIITNDLFIDKILIYDVTIPSSPTKVTSIELCDTSTVSAIHDFEVSGERLYVVYRPNQSTSVSASVYNLRDPASPQRIFYINNLSWQYSNITGTGDYVIVSNSSGSVNVPVVVYDINNPDKPISFNIEPELYMAEADTVVLQNSNSLFFYRAASAYASLTRIPLDCFNK